MAVTETTPLLTSGNGSRIRSNGTTDPVKPAIDPSLDPTKVDSRRKALIFAAIWTGVFLGAIDTTIVATLVSSISSSFHSSQQASWLATSYLLATATFTPLYGRLADILGRRWAHLTALLLFTVGTLLCALATSMNALIVARLVAGMGGGGIMTTSSIIASDLIPLKRRGFVQGLVNICFGAGAGLGGPLGGLISDTIGWRWAFLIQVPILVLAIILVVAFVHYRLPGQATSKLEMAKRIDYGGSATLIICVGSLLLALSFKNNEQHPWGSPTVWGPLIVFAVFLFLFVLVEACFAKEPVMPMRILTLRSPFFIAWLNFIVSMGAFSTLYMIPLFFETVILDPSSTAGLHLVPNSVALALGSLFAGWYMRRTGKYYRLIVSCSLLPVLAFALMASMNRETGWIGKWLYILPAGFGFSVEITALLIALISAVPRSDMAVATGLSYLFRYCGQVVGVALSSSVLQAVLASELSKRITGPGSKELIERIRHTSTIVRTLPPAEREAAVASYSVGLRWVFLMNLGMALVGTLLSMPLHEYPLPGTFEEEVQRADGAPGEEESSAA